MDLSMHSTVRPCPHLRVFSVRLGLSPTHKRHSRSLKTEFFEKSCQGEDGKTQADIGRTVMEETKTHAVENV